MSQPRFLADHDFNDQIVYGLLRLEPAVSLVRAREMGLDRKADPELLEYAAEHSLIVLSHDVNTMRGHAYARLAAGKPMAGLLIARQSTAVAKVIESLLLVWSASDAEEWHGTVDYLPL